LIIACKVGNFNEFKDAIDNDVKLKIGMINSLYQKDNDFHFLKGNKYQKEEIKDYLRDRIDKLEDIIHPRDIKKIDKIKIYLGTKISKGHREYPRGYKIYRILKYVDENTITSAKQLVKLIYDLSYGKDTFNPLMNSGYWSDGLSAIVYPNMDKIGDKFVLNSKGKSKLQKYDSKFGKIKITPPPYV